MTEQGGIMKARNGLGCAIVGAFLIAGAASTHAAQRTFVSTLGSDLNACSLAAPCRAFARAITQTDPAGEIIALDSGGYGAVVVDKNVSIVSPAGVYAGISVFAGEDGVLVSAPATKVVLRGLSINGQGGDHGIRVQAGEVHIENSVISNIGGVGAAGILIEGGTSVRIAGTVVRSNTEGMRVLPGAGTVSVLVRDSEFTNNGTIGIRVSPSGAGNSALVTVERTSLTKSTGYGIYSGPVGGATATIVVTQSVVSENAIAGVASELSGATVWVRESAVTRNGTGLRQAGTSVLNACGANLLVANTMATSGAINTGSCLDVASGSGTVTSVATGAGLTGGPITTSGSISVDTTYLQRRVSGTCGSGASVRAINADGTVVCETDDVGIGTVTSVATGTGLTGGPITGAGTVSIANAGVGNAQLANGSVNVAKLDTTSTDGRYFKQGGNSLGTIAVLGTADNQTLELWTNNSAGFRLQPTVADPANGFHTATQNVIGGWNVNAASAGVIGATVGGGGGEIGVSMRFNLVTDHYGTIGGGAGNRAGDGLGTTDDQGYATVGGGSLNKASGRYGIVGGGRINEASGQFSAVGGGEGNEAGGLYSTIAGGASGTASGIGASIGGGGARGCGLGCYQTSPNDATGDASTVPGGFDNTAAGDFSFAAGRHAKAMHAGTFVWADSTDFDFSSAASNTFRVRSTNGARFVTEIDGTGATTWSCVTTAGNSWACASDRNLKHSLVELDGKAVLAKLAAVPIYQWQPKGKNAHLRHYGPMAQDFYAAFELGEDDKMIGMQDADGVALAAIRGVNQKVDEQLRARDEEIAALRASVIELGRRVDALIAVR